MRTRIPDIGLGFGLRALSRSGHPTLAVLLLVVFVVAIVVAARNGRDRR